MYKVTFARGEQMLFGVERLFGSICIHVLCFQIFVRQVTEIKIKGHEYDVDIHFIKGFNS